jgi:hypothetical protein
MLQVAACRTPFVGQVANASRGSTFAGAKISAKAMRTASRKSAVAAQAKVRLFFMKFELTTLKKRFVDPNY